MARVPPRQELGIEGTRKALEGIPQRVVRRSKPPHLSLIQRIEKETGQLTNYNDLVAALRSLTR